MTESRNSVLKHSVEVEAAVKRLRSLGVFAHHDRPKSWDTCNMVNAINNADRNAFILDVGCNGSPILPILGRIGFKNLYGCDLNLEPRYPIPLLKFACFFIRRDYRPVLELFEHDSFNLSVQNLKNTSFQDDMFDYITCLSVIEHGVDSEQYFKEMSRILKVGGLLLTSTDYWPDKIPNNSKGAYGKHPDNIFSRDEIEDLIRIAEKNNLELLEPIDFTYQDRVVHWPVTGLDFTFIFFALKKKK
jgi:SAM-dependent methyltransferase